MKLTLQEFYNTLVQGAADGILPSYENDFGCRYRSGDKRCAVGLFIPDKDYRESMEGVSGKDFYPILRDILPPEIDDVLLSAIQACHDDFFCRAHLKEDPFKTYFVKRLNSLQVFQNVELLDPEIFSC